MSTESNIDAAREYYETHSAADKIENAVPGDPATTSPMSGYSVRLPTEVLNRARALASERGMTTGAWMREAIEKQIAADSSEYGDEASAINALIELMIQYRPRTRVSRDPALGSWRVDLLRDWNTAHLRNLGVDALISGAGMDSWIAPPAARSEPRKAEAGAGKAKRIIKTRSNSSLFSTTYVRNGHTVRIKDAAPSSRRRRRSSSI